MHEADIWHWPPYFYPVRPTLQNYWEVLFGTDYDLPILRWTFNSAFMAFSRIGLELTIASMAAYAFARLEFPGRDKIFFVILTTMMIPGQVTLVPMYLQIGRYGWIDTFHALIWPGAASVFPVFMLRQFFQTIPQDLEEAAILDGCGRLRVLWHVIMPLSTPALSALSIFIFMGNWNALFWPMIVTNSNEMRTLVAGLALLRATHGLYRARVMAAAVFSIIPVIIFYSIFQRQIIQGVAMTGLAGR
jgi:multiple sugar transport system permease protein